MIQEARRQDNGGEGDIVLTADVIATSVGGRLIGDPATRVRGIAPLDRASADELSFLASRKYARLLAESSAGVVLVTPELSESPGAAQARIVVAKPHDALLSLIPRFYRARERVSGIHRTAEIGHSARLGADVSIGPYVVIGDGAVIGDRVVLDSHVVVGDGVRVGNDAHFYPARIVLALVQTRSGGTQEAAKALAEARRLRPRLTLPEVRLWAGRTLDALAGRLGLRGAKT